MKKIHKFHRVDVFENNRFLARNLENGSEARFVFNSKLNEKNRDNIYLTLVKRINAYKNQLDKNKIIDIIEKYGHIHSTVCMRIQVVVNGECLSDGDICIVGDKRSIVGVRRGTILIRDMDRGSLDVTTVGKFLDSFCLFLYITNILTNPYKEDYDFTKYKFQYKRKWNRFYTDPNHHVVDFFNIVNGFHYNKHHETYATRKIKRLYAKLKSIENGKYVNFRWSDLIFIDSNNRIYIKR